MEGTEYWMGRNCGVTFAGIKPASLLSIKFEEVEQAARIASCFLQRGIFFLCLKRCRTRCVMLVYRKSALQSILFAQENKKFLQECGYTYTTVEEALRELKKRMQTDDFPHEIGIFLGYPLCDVKGFLRSPHEGIQLCGYWKVYDDAEGAAKKFDRFRKCSACICKRMQQGESLANIFRVG